MFVRISLIDKQPNLALMFLSAFQYFSVQIRIISIYFFISPAPISPQAKVARETTGPRVIIRRGPS